MGGGSRRYHLCSASSCVLRMLAAIRHDTPQYLAQQYLCRLSALEQGVAGVGTQATAILSPGQPDGRRHVLSPDLTMILLCQPAEGYEWSELERVYDLDLDGFARLVPNEPGPGPSAPADAATSAIAALAAALDEHPERLAEIEEKVVEPGYLEERLRVEIATLAAFLAPSHGQELQLVFA